MKLEPCPCGEIPKDIGIEDDGYPHRWMYAYGTCCSRWNVEFKSYYMQGEELKKIAIEAWNNAPRSRSK